VAEGKKVEMAIRRSGGKTETEKQARNIVGINYLEKFEQNTNKNPSQTTRHHDKKGDTRTTFTADRGTQSDTKTFRGH